LDGGIAAKRRQIIAPLCAAELGPGGNYRYLLPIDMKARFCPNSPERRAVYERRRGIVQSNKRTLSTPPENLDIGLLGTQTCPVRAAVGEV
jgi:hypothetical protein